MKIERGLPKIGHTIKTYVARSYLLPWIDRQKKIIVKSFEFVPTKCMAWTLITYKSPLAKKEFIGIEIVW